MRPKLDTQHGRSPKYDKTSAHFYTKYQSKSGSTSEEKNLDRNLDRNPDRGHDRNQERTLVSHESTQLVKGDRGDRSSSGGEYREGFDRDGERRQKGGYQGK